MTSAIPQERSETGKAVIITAWTGAGIGVYGIHAYLFWIGGGVQFMEYTPIRGRATRAVNALIDGTWRGCSSGAYL